MYVCMYIYTYKPAKMPPIVSGEVPFISPVSLNFFVCWFPCLIPIAQNHMFLLGKTWKNPGIYWSKSINIPYFLGKKKTPQHLNADVSTSPASAQRLGRGSLIAGTSRSDAEQRASISFLPASYFQEGRGGKKRRTDPMFKWFNQPPMGILGSSAISTMIYSRNWIR